MTRASADILIAMRDVRKSYFLGSGEEIPVLK